MKCAISLLFAGFIFSTSNAIAPLIPNDKELLYDYSALIKCGTEIPEKFASQFYLYAKLRIQAPSVTSLLVQLTNITYKLYNGQEKVGYKREFHEAHVASERTDLTQPFEVILNSNGQAEGIATEKSEKLYARNVHKALAGLLQLKIDTINFNSIKPDTFVTREHSIYGKGRTIYTVLPKDEELIIKKMHEPVSTQRMYQLVTTNSEGDMCEAQYEEPLAHDSHQHYIFKKTGDNYILKHIKSKAGLYFYPFRAKSEAHYVHSSTSINFISIASIGTPIKVQDPKHEKDLTYDIFEPTLETEESFYEMLEGRHLTDYKTIITALAAIFDNMFLYLQGNHMHNDNMDIRKTQLINNAIRLLRTCNSDKLEKVYNNLISDNSVTGKQHLKLFYEVLPFVGTHASVILVKKIVYDKKVNDEIALDMLQAVASYVRFPTEALLHDSEDMLTWGDEISKNVRKTAALSFGILIHKTFKAEVALSSRKHEDHSKASSFHQTGSHAFSQDTEEVRRFLKEHTIYKQYIDNLANKLKTSTDIELELLYLQVIFNTKLPVAIPHLIPIVTGEEPKNHDVREMALWALSHMLLGDPDLISKLYWPIVTDRHQHTELRIAAYYVIMKSRPSLTGMLNMHYVMQAETNTELYNFHYSYLQAMSQSDDPCNQISKLNAAQILKFTHKPNQQALSGYYQMNFSDKKYGHGFEINNFYIKTDRTRIFVSDITWQMFNKRSNYYLLFFKIGGLEKQLSRTLEFNLKNSFGLLNYGEIWNTILSFQDMKNFHIQISISNNYHTVQLYYFNRSNLQEFFDMCKNLFNNKILIDKKFLNIHYEDATELIFPTEIGLPASLETFVPTLTSKQFKITTKEERNITTFLLDVKFQGLRSISWGLDFYNPIVGVSQGIKRYHAYDSVLPLLMEISIDHEQQSLLLTWKTHAEKEANIIGLRSYVTNFVYIDEYANKNILQASCTDCKNWVQVTRGDAFRYNYTVFYDEGLTTGFASKALIFDAERHANTDSLNTLIQGATHNKNMTRLEKFLTLLRNFRLNDIFQPSPGTQGYLFTLCPLVTQLDMTLSFKETIKQHKNEFLPSIKFNPHLKYQLRNNDIATKTLDIDIIIETDVGHTFQTIKADIISTGKEIKDQKICINSNKTWTAEGVGGHISISTSKTSADECQDMIMYVELKGEQLEEQKTPFHIYEVCDTYSHNFKPDYHSMRCLAEHTSIRKYVYDINIHKTSTEYENIARDLLFFFLDKHKVYHNYYTNNKVNEVGNIKIIVQYLNENEANVHIITPHGTHELNAVSTSDLLWVGLKPDNTHFSTFFLWMNYIGMVHTCSVGIDEIQHEFNEEKQIQKSSIGDEWTMVIGDTEVDPQQAVFLKKYGDNKLSLKIAYKNQTLEIIPLDDQGEQFKIIFDGKELLQIMDHYKEDWFSYVIRPHLKSVIVTIFHFELHLDYTAEQLIVQTPKVSGVSFYGPCAKSNNTVEETKKILV